MKTLWRWVLRLLKSERHDTPINLCLCLVWAYSAYSFYHMGAYGLAMFAAWALGIRFDMVGAKADPPKNSKVVSTAA